MHRIMYNCKGIQKSGKFETKIIRYYIFSGILNPIPIDKKNNIEQKHMQIYPLNNLFIISL